MKLLLIFVLLCSCPMLSLRADVLRQQDEEQNQECDFSEFRYVVMSHLRIPAKEKVEPEYPPLASASKIAGIVQVKLLVNREGSVIRACATTGHRLLREAAIVAAKKWRFVRHFGFRPEWKAEYMQQWILFNFKLD